MRSLMAVLGGIVFLVIGVFGISTIASSTRDAAVTNGTNESAEAFTRHEYNAEKREKIFQALNRYQLSKEFGWTPSQIDSIPDHELRRYQAVMEGIGEAKKEQQD